MAPLAKLVADVEREIVGESPHSADRSAAGWLGTMETPEGRRDVTAPATPEAQQWQGYGTSLKPAHEPIVVARKPLIGTVASNVLQHGTGAINVDGCRIKGAPRAFTHTDKTSRSAGIMGDTNGARQGVAESSPLGRWPANLVLSHSPGCVPAGTRRVKTQNPATRYGNTPGWTPSGVEREHVDKARPDYADPDGLETVEAWDCEPGCVVAELDAQSGELQADRHRAGFYNNAGIGIWGNAGGAAFTGRDDAPGGASRFYFCAKASAGERNAGLDGFEVRETPGYQPKTQVCGECECRTVGPSGLVCGHDAQTFTEGVIKGARKNVHPLDDSKAPRPHALVGPPSNAPGRDMPRPIRRQRQHRLRRCPGRVQLHRDRARRRVRRHS